MLAFEGNTDGDGPASGRIGSSGIGGGAGGLKGSGTGAAVSSPASSGTRDKFKRNRFDRASQEDPHFLLFLLRVWYMIDKQ